MGILVRLSVTYTLKIWIHHHENIHIFKQKIVHAFVWFWTTQSVDRLKLRTMVDSVKTEKLKVCSNFPFVLGFTKTTLNTNNQKPSRIFVINLPTSIEKSPFPSESMKMYNGSYDRLFTTSELWRVKKYWDSKPRFSSVMIYMYCRANPLYQRSNDISRSKVMINKTKCLLFYILCFFNLFIYVKKTECKSICVTTCKEKI